MVFGTRNPAVPRIRTHLPQNLPALIVFHFKLSLFPIFPLFSLYETLPGRVPFLTIIYLLPENRERR
jgi:hypothetical protein